MSDSSSDSDTGSIIETHRLTEAEWIEEYYDEISAVFTSLQDYMRAYAPRGILGNLRFNAFCKFCYQNS
jgi:hypothetical protein